jgi:hypothetical protein
MSEELRASQRATEAKQQNSTAADDQCGFQHGEFPFSLYSNDTL